MAIEIGPQEGFQAKVLSSGADITVIGGAAGAGKSFVELLAAARHVQPHRGLNGKLYRPRAGFACVFFRRTTKQIRVPNGLWDDARRIYPLLGGKPNQTDLEYNWSRWQCKVKFAGLEHEDSVLDWHGSQIPLLIFDELPTFTAKQFWYMQSRNRSACGIRPYTIASCNPDADSWVAELIAWWIDQDESSPTYGLPIPERAGVLRYFTRQGDELIWGNSIGEVVDQVPGLRPEFVNSLTFIPGRLDENKILEKADPSYRAKLMAMTRVERARLLGGNWKVRAIAGTYFQRHEVTMLDAAPPAREFVSLIRRWDLAASIPTATDPNPDWTCGVLMGKTRDKRFIVLDVIFIRKRADDVRQTIKRTAIADGRRVKIGLPQDPGQAGKEQIESYAKFLSGWTVIKDRETGDKETRAEGFASQWQHGNVWVVRGEWNREYFHQLEGFPGVGIHDDAVDASSGGFSKVNKGTSMFDVS
jgi:predicted phage terminase large subunit-like protein